jgi:hypothetical protein
MPVLLFVILIGVAIMLSSLLILCYQWWLAKYS